jgi:hypothetical protein
MIIPPLSTENSTRAKQFHDKYIEYQNDCPTLRIEIDTALMNGCNWMKDVGIGAGRVWICYDELKWPGSTDSSFNQIHSILSTDPKCFCNVGGTESISILDFEFEPFKDERYVWESVYSRFCVTDDLLPAINVPFLRTSLDETNKEDQTTVVTPTTVHTFASHVAFYLFNRFVIPFHSICPIFNSSSSSSSSSFDNDDQELQWYEHHSIQLHNGSIRWPSVRPHCTSNCSDCYNPVRFTAKLIGGVFDKQYDMAFSEVIGLDQFAEQIRIYNSAASTWHWQLWNIPLNDIKTMLSIMTTASTTVNNDYEFVLLLSRQLAVSSSSTTTTTNPAADPFFIPCQHYTGCELPLRFIRISTHRDPKVRSYCFEPLLSTTVPGDCGSTILARQRSTGNSFPIGFHYLRRGKLTFAMPLLSVLHHLNSEFPDTTSSEQVDISVVRIAPIVCTTPIMESSGHDVFV